MTYEQESNVIKMEAVPENVVPMQKGIFTTLAELPAKAILTESAMAKAFGVTGRTIRRMVNRYELPPPVMISGRSSWLAGRVLAWIEERAERQEKVATREKAKIDAYNY